VNTEVEIFDGMALTG